MSALAWFYNRMLVFFVAEETKYHLIEVELMSENSKEDSLKKYEFSKDMFHQLWELNEHEDTKATRILTAISFLALTAVTAFGVFVSRKISVQIALGFFHFDLISISFAGIAIFISLGVFVFLEASLGGIHVDGKRHTIRNRTGKNGLSKNFEPESLFYYKRIAEENPQQWIKYFEGNLNDLLNKATADHIRETYSISERSKTKVKLHKIGKLCFYVAIVFFIILALAGCSAL